MTTTLGGWLLHVMQQTDSALSLDEALHVLMDSMKDYFPCQSAAVVLLDEETKELRIRVSRQLSYAFVREFRRTVHGSAIEQVILSHKPVMQNDADRCSDDYRDLKLEHDFSAAILVPVVKMQRGVGYLFADRSDASFSETDRLHLEVIGMLTGNLIEKFELIQSSRQLSSLDPSSRTLHYKAFVPALATELSRARIHHYPLALALVAMDAYRRCVETRGMDGAHALLADTAAVIQANLRDVDLLARFSADQFILCLSGTAHAEAAARLESIRSAVAGKVAGPDGQPAISAIGTVSLAATPAASNTLRDLLAALGNALMQARNPAHSGLYITEMPHERDPHG